MLIFDDEKFRSVNIPTSILCRHPLRLASGDIVPCGHCDICNERIKKDWMTRLNLQAKVSPAYFLTLTFSDNYLDDTSYSVVKHFLDRYNKRFGKFKYFGCFERGDKTKRPHYHLIIFGHMPTLSYFKNKECYSCADGSRIANPNLNELFAFHVWHHGFVDIKPLSLTGQNSIGYVVGYVQKKRDLSYMTRLYRTNVLSRSRFSILNKFSKNDFEFNQIISKYLGRPYVLGRLPFYFMSKGIGFDYITDLLTKFNFPQENIKSIVVGGKSVPVPRAFIKKFDFFKKDYCEKFEDKLPYYLQYYCKKNNIKIDDIINEFDLDYSVKPDFYDDFFKWFKKFCSSYLTKTQYSNRILSDD